MTNWRARVLRRPYGDQGLFTTADLFRTVGGFPEWPIMEDVEFVRRLRREGRIDIAAAPMLISARRWQQQGIIHTTLINQACLLAHGLGWPPHRIARWRRRDSARPGWTQRVLAPLGPRGCQTEFLP